MDQAPLNAQQKCLALNKCYYYYYYYYFQMKHQLHK